MLIIFRMIDGVEVNIHALDPERDIPRLRQICDDLDFDISVLLVYTPISLFGNRD